MQDKHFFKGLIVLEYFKHNGKLSGCTWGYTRDSVILNSTVNSHLHTKQCKNDNLGVRDQQR